MPDFFTGESTVNAERAGALCHSGGSQALAGPNIVGLFPRFSWRQSLLFLGKTPKTIASREIIERTPIALNDLRSDKGRAIGRQKDGEIGDVLRFSQTPQQGAVFYQLHNGVGYDSFEQVRGDRAWRNGIAADALFTIDCGN